MLNMLNMLNTLLRLIILSHSLILSSGGDLEFISVKPNETFSPVGFNFFALTRPESSQYSYLLEKILSGDVLPDFSNSRHLQYHGVDIDRRGMFYNPHSVVLEPCRIGERVEEFFYQPVPTEFRRGSVALVPCYITGVPNPTTVMERCGDESCNTTTGVTAREYRRTADGHLVINNPELDDSGWYRCRGDNGCGKVTTRPTFIKISDDVEHSQNVYVISRRPANSEFNLTVSDEYHGVGTVLRTLDRSLTPLQQYHLNTTTPSCTDEVLFLAPQPIRLWHYNLHTSTPEVILPPHYGYFRHNVTKTDTTFTLLDDQVWSWGEGGMTDMLTFETMVLGSPKFTLPGDLVFRGAAVAVVRFGYVVYNRELFRDFSVGCYRTTELLADNWKIRLEVTDSEIVIRISDPLEADSGYYQCGVLFDVEFISEPVYVEVVEPARTYSSGSVTTPTSLSLTWRFQADHPLTSPNTTYVVVLEGPHKREYYETTSSRMVIEGLAPYTPYTWHLISPDSTPITDPAQIRTNKTVPWLGVGHIRVQRQEKSLVLSWSPLEEAAWHDHYVYYNLTVVAARDPTRVVHHDVHNAAELEVPGLSSATDYNVSVTPCNRMGCSTNTSTVSTSTKPVLLTLAPEVRVVHITRTSVTILPVRVPEEAELYLEILPGDGCFVAPDAPSDIMIKITNQTELTDLRTFTRYSLRVHATNGYSTSPWSACARLRTRFNYWHVAVPASCLLLTLLLLVLLRAAVRTRCPDVLNKVRQVLEPKYMNVLYQEEYTATSNEITIVHDKLEIGHVS